MSIFKAYDIRGVYGQDLTEDIAYRIGLAYVDFLGCKNVAVGRDMRAHSVSLSQRLIQGLRDAGAGVTSYGMIPTPALYFAVANYGHDGGLCVTASHNPPKYNGFKLTRESAIPISEDTGIREIATRVQQGISKKAAAAGGYAERDLTDDYIRHVLKFAGGPVKPLRVALDASNGMGGLYARTILDRLGLRWTGLYLEPDGNFPNHEANPLKAEVLHDLQGKVRETGADLGVIYDGDCDRCAFVDDKGDIVPCDLVTALLAQDVLSREKGPVLYDVRSSWIVQETVAALGGTPVEERVGHSFMKATLRRIGGIFGGELSGHYYFRDNFYCDSGEIAMVSMVRLLSSRAQKLSELLRPLRCYFQTGELNFHVEDKAGMMQRIVETFPEGKLSKLDGIKLEFADWWCNIRPSNTEPVLRLNLEGRTRAAMETGKAKLLAILGTPE